MPEIKIKNLKKTFKEQAVLNGVNLTCEHGKITVILGQSGQGKTVLLKHLIGLLAPDEGEIFIDKVDITKLSKYELKNIRSKFGYLFQDAALFDYMNVYENIGFPLQEHTNFSESKIKSIIKEKLSIVGLHGIENKMPSELSGGMRKRVGLARAIVLEPEILLFDEPTTGLDPIMTNTIDALILETTQKLKVTSIIISHDIQSSLRLGSKIAMLHNGKIIEETSPQQFVKSTDPLVKQFLAGDILKNNQNGVR